MFLMIIYIVGGEGGVCFFILKTQIQKFLCSDVVIGTYGQKNVIGNGLSIIQQTNQFIFNFISYRK
jgi:hypothetical protein